MVWKQFLNYEKKNYDFKLILITNETINLFEIIDNLKYFPDGIILKNETTDVLYNCLSTIKKQSIYISQILKNKIKSESNINLLTPTELYIAKKIIKGESSKEICSAMYRSLDTIQNHRKSIKRKLDIKGGKNNFITLLKLSIID